MSKKSSNFLSLRERLLHAIFGLRHYVSPEITVAKSSKWQNKIHFISYFTTFKRLFWKKSCVFGFFVVILQAKLQGAI